MCLDYLIESVEPIDIGYQVKLYIDKGRFKSLYFDDNKNIKVGLIFSTSTKHFKIGKTYRVPSGMRLVRTNSMFEFEKRPYIPYREQIHSGYYFPGFHIFHELSSARGYESMSWKKRTNTVILEVEARGDKIVGVQHHSLVTVATEIKIIRIVPDTENCYIDE